MNMKFSYRGASADCTRPKPHEQSTKLSTREPLQTSNNDRGGGHAPEVVAPRRQAVRLVDYDARQPTPAGAAHPGPCEGSSPNADA